MASAETARVSDAQMYGVHTENLQLLRERLKEAIDDDSNAPDMLRACRGLKSEIISAAGRHPCWGRLDAALHNGQGGTALNIIDEILTGQSL